MHYLMNLPSGLVFHILEEIFVSHEQYDLPFVASLKKRLIFTPEHHLFCLTLNISAVFKQAVFSFLRSKVPLFFVTFHEESRRM
jgi:hypothetical protein